VIAGKGGRVSVIESSKSVGEWRSRVALAAADVLYTDPNGDGSKHLEPTSHAVVLNARFIFARPASHLKKSGELRAGVPRLPIGRGTPDVDKLVRAVLDALTGIAFVDDSQVVGINAGAEYGNTNGAELSWSVIA
jgi:crossover junction endodeoxyribonuclease RusA